MDDIIPMQRWSVEVKERVRKREIPKLPRDVQLILSQALTDLENEGPFPYGWNVKQLEKGKNRMWLKHNWRLIYTYEKQELLIEIIYAGSKENVPY